MQHLQFLLIYSLQSILYSLLVSLSPPKHFKIYYINLQLSQFKQATLNTILTNKQLPVQLEIQLIPTFATFNLNVRSSKLQRDVSKAEKQINI